MRTLIANLRGGIVAILLLLNMIFIGASILLGACFVWVVPWRPWHHYGTKILLLLPTLWMVFNHWIFNISSYGKWHIDGTGQLNPKGWYILIANHQSWIDILVLGILFNHRLPIIKFFMKKQLRWSLPLAGLACQALGYPFMERHSRDDIRKNPALKGKDVETVKLACKKFKEHPTTIMNFVEGTRFSSEKHQRQQAPYQHLLKPKAIGVGVVLEQLGDKLDGIVNATINYLPGKLSLWQILCGQLDRIQVHYEVIPVTADLIGDCHADRDFRRQLQTWVNQLWKDKDERLEKLRS